MNPLGTHPQFDPNASGITVFNPQARPLFERARWYGNLNRLLGAVGKQSWRLLLLSEVVTEAMVYAAERSGIRAVAADLIQGSVNPCEDFDRSHHPLSDRVETRWVRIASMMLQGAALPPVELIRVREIYFVVDGHHRISVARALGHAAVDAVITASYD